MGSFLPSFPHAPAPPHHARCDDALHALALAHDAWEYGTGGDDAALAAAFGGCEPSYLGVGLQTSARLYLALQSASVLLSAERYEEALQTYDDAEALVAQLSEVGFAPCLTACN